MNVVNLVECRDLLRGMDVMRERILKGRVKGFAVTVLEWDDSESVYFLGQYRDNTEAACKAAMRMSWEMERQSRPDFKASRM